MATAARMCSIDGTDKGWDLDVCVRFVKTGGSRPTFPESPADVAPSICSSSWFGAGAAVWGSLHLLTHSVCSPPAPPPPLKPLPTLSVAPPLGFVALKSSLISRCFPGEVMFAAQPHYCRDSLSSISSSFPFSGISLLGH